MRYEVHGFKQVNALELGLNSDELLILRHFEDFANSGKMDSFYENGKMFYWVNYEAFLKNLPILNINKKRLGDIMVHNLGTEPSNLRANIGNYSVNMQEKIKKRKYVGLLISKTVKNSEIGTRSYFAFTDKFYSLKLDIVTDVNKDELGGAVKIPHGCSKNTATGAVKIPQQRFIYNKIDNIYSPVIEKLNKLAGKNYKSTTSKTKSLIDARINEGFVLEDFYKVIEIKTSKWKGTDMDQYLRPSTLFGTNFESYLNEKVKKPLHSSPIDDFEEI